MYCVLLVISLSFAIFVLDGSYVLLLQVSTLPIRGVHYDLVKEYGFNTTRTVLGYLRPSAATVAICAGTLVFPLSTSQFSPTEYQTGIKSGQDYTWGTRPDCGEGGDRPRESS